MPGKKQARYVYSPQHIKAIFEKIKSTGRPEKLSASYLKKTWLLQDNNYSAVLAILKDMKFLDDGGTPLDRYAEYQNQKLAKKAVAAGLQSAYPNLFAAYPNACSLPKSDLEGYFRQQTGASTSVLDKIVATFSTLCGEADFSEVRVGDGSKNIESPIASKDKGISVSPSLQVNIEIHIDANTSDETIETIFMNMKKYLFPS